MDRIYQRAMREISGIRRVQLKEMGSDVMATSLAPVALVIYGKDFPILDQLGKGVLNIAKTEVVNPRSHKPDVSQPFLSWDLSKPTYTLVVNQDKAARHGLTPAKIAEQIGPLNKLLEMRKNLNQLLSKMEGNDKLEKLLNDVIGNTEKAQAMKSILQEGEDK